ncbi:basic region leucine zipper [Ancylostoma ceylanicum]|uniref:Basic region leucine zipper n=1 Tax=Ancylostoma ceylanicum TaxID=53326 RepID=A0A0D6LY53_9BILA|nr:basic region leucine zipper [Ancylostoma ceylanicum]
MLPAFAQTAFDPNPFAYSPYGYNPSLTTYGTPVSSMPQSYYQDTSSYAKSESDSTPEEKRKDPLSVITDDEQRQQHLLSSRQRYLAKRHKNNLAAQKSRKIRRQREESITKTADLLRAENESLKNEIVQLREMITDLRKQLSSSCSAPAPAEPMRESSNIVRDTYNPYQTFQIGFSINSQL